MPSLLTLPKSRMDARATGSTHYFTGKPCKRGHVKQRFASDAACVECQRDYQKSPKWKSYKREFDREYQKSPRWLDYQRDYHREFSTRRRASKLDATPTWLTPDHIDQMRATYAKAARLTEATSIPRHVDHIIPLVHPDVCGLHVPWNLQILTAEDNWRKNNAFDGTMENESWKK